MRLDNIHAGYNKREVLRGIDMAVFDKEIVTIIGHNGAGKSTLLKAIAGLIKPVSGRIIFNEIDITNKPIGKRVSLGIGYFLQGGEVFSDLTVLENFEVGGIKLNKGIFKERLDVVLSLFPLLKERLNVRAGLLSGGQRQMLALGMILLNRPRLLLLDEPSAGLSPALVNEVLGKVQEINKTQGVTVILVEQKVKESVSIADRVIMLSNGQVAFEGSSYEWKTKKEELVYLN